MFLDHEGALAWSGLDQAEVDEPLDRVADGIPRRAVAVPELEFSGQLAARAELVRTRSADAGLRRSAGTWGSPSSLLSIRGHPSHRNDPSRPVIHATRLAGIFSVSRFIPSPTVVTPASGTKGWDGLDDRVRRFYPSSRLLGRTGICQMAPESRTVRLDWMYRTARTDRGHTGAVATGNRQGVNTSPGLGWPGGAAPVDQVVSPARGTPGFVSCSRGDRLDVGFRCADTASCQPSQPMGLPVKWNRSRCPNHGI